MSDAISKMIQSIFAPHTMHVTKHVHVASHDEDGKMTESCALCGKTFRDTDVHVTSVEFDARRAVS